MINKLNKIIRKIEEGMLQEMYLESKWMYKYAIKYKYSIIYYIFLGILGTLMTLIGNITSKYLIDSVTGYNSRNTILVAIALVLFGIGSIVIKAITNRISTKIDIKVNNEIQREVYDKILITEWESMNDFHSGDLLNRLNGDVSTVASSVLGWIPNLITRSVQFLGALAIILYYDSTMAAVALLGAPVTVIISKALMKRMRFFNKEMREISSKVMSFNEETFQNMQSIKTFDLIGLFGKRLKIVQEEYREISLKYNKFSLFTSSFMASVGLLVSYSCFGWGVYRLWSGKITFGTMVLFLQLASTLSESFKSLVSLVPTAISATISSRRLMDFFELPDEKIKNKEELNHIEKKTKNRGIRVEINNAKFNYKNGEVIFKNAQIIANPSEVIALVGPSGEGKTTMMKVLLGLINLKDGSAFIKDYSGVKCEISPGTRRLMAYVPQEKTMFSGTIAENMRMVKEDATDEEIVEALTAACAYEFVSKLPEGINSKVGERGNGFSEGQNQRLSIARALIRNSPILLLDEATSALDVATERRVLRNIMSLNANKTCIVTTHRPSVLNMCDRVYKISQTQVTEVTTEEVEQMVVDF